jgi:hypothetical protein
VSIYKYVRGHEYALSSLLGFRREEEHGSLVTSRWGRAVRYGGPTVTRPSFSGSLVR